MPSGDHFVCFGGPFFESAAMADEVVQPITWTDDQCGLLLVFQATLPNGDEGQASHVTCS